MEKSNKVGARKKDSKRCSSLTMTATSPKNGRRSEETWTEAFRQCHEVSSKKTASKWTQTSATPAPVAYVMVPVMNLPPNVPFPFGNFMPPPSSFAMLAPVHFQCNQNPFRAFQQHPFPLVNSFSASSSGFSWSSTGLSGHSSKPTISATYPPRPKNPRGENFVKPKSPPKRNYRSKVPKIVFPVDFTERPVDLTVKPTKKGGAK